MPFDLNVFKQNLATYGTASTNKFDVNIGLCPAMNSLRGDPRFGYLNASQSMIPFRAEASTTPGVGLITTDVNKWGYGPRIRQAYNTVLSDVRVVLLADSGGDMEQFFMAWMNFIYDFSYSSIPSVAAFTANYRQDVVSTVTINKYDRSGKIINTYNLFEAIPIRYSPISLDWNQTDTNVKLIVEFAYTSFTLDVSTT